MRVDCHVHTRMGEGYMDLANYNPEKFQAQIKESGMDGLAVYSPSPKRYEKKSWEERMKAGLEYCKGYDNLFPFYWINPLDEDALFQVDKAIEMGYVAFKIICFDFYPSDKRCMDVCEKIAQRGKAVMFHSGICWDGRNSANFNKPSNFECLIDIPKLRFCLAHLSWPWTDECIAVYGKFNNDCYTKTPEMQCEMFIDVTPGTPEVYREEVFRKLILTGYDIDDHLMFGSDRNTDDYTVSFIKNWQSIDDGLYAKYYKGDLEKFKANVYGNNFFKFIGMDAPQK